MQGEFLYEILKTCQEEKIHTAIETTINMYGSLELIKNIPYLDLIYIDLKFLMKETHGIN